MVSFDGTNVHLSLGIPRGHDGTNGNDGAPGGQGASGGQGDPGPQGPPFANLIIDSVTTLDLGQPATASVSFDGTNVHLSLGIPRADKGDKGDKGDPGEVTQAALDAVEAGTARNINAISDLSGWEPNDPPTADDLRTIRDKLNEVINGLRRP